MIKPGSEVDGRVGWRLTNLGGATPPSHAELGGTGLELFDACGGA